LVIAGTASFRNLHHDAIGVADSSGLDRGAGGGGGKTKGQHEAQEYEPTKYSPDLNPIEQVFAMLKHLLRKTAARTVETVGAAIGELLGTFTKNECANYFKNSGYAPN
jgi:hypothetical protein